MSSVPWCSPRPCTEMNQLCQDILCSGEETPRSDDSPPLRKRQRNSNTTITKRRQLPLRKHGSLAKLVDMPLDVLYEIFGHLQPIDLLHLVRTSWALRNMLLNRTATCVWKSARMTLPHKDLFLDCPEDMSEPEYAYLLFDARCHFCRTARVKHPLWAWRVRCCKNCLPIYFEDEFQISIDYRNAAELYACHPREKPGKRRIYLKLAFAKFYELVQDIRVQGGEEALASFLKERSAAVTNINKRAIEEQNYSKRREEAHDDDLANIRQQRHNAIKNELCALGWEEEFNLMQGDKRDFQRHPFVSQSKPLTERIWNNNRSTMIKFMEEMKTKRLERERTDLIIKRHKILTSLLDAYRQTRAIEEIVPKVGDVALMLPFKEIIEADNDVVVTVESFANAMSQLPELCARWREQKDEFLLTLIPSSNQDTETRPPRNVLGLATTLFKCKGCCQPISYPRILSHKCMTDDDWGFELTTLAGNWGFELTSTQAKEIRRYASMSQFPWNFGGVWVDYHEAGAKYAAEVLRACDLDPEVTTAEQMDLRHIRLVCACKHTELNYATSDARYFMNWRKAIDHAIMRHSNTNTPWTVIDGSKRVLDGRLLKVMYPVEKKFLDQMEAGFKDWSCRRCVTFQGTLVDIKKHLHDTHGISVDAFTDEHFFRHLDAPPGRRHAFAIPEEMLARLSHNQGDVRCAGSWIHFHWETM